MVGLRFVALGLACALAVLVPTSPVRAEEKLKDEALSEEGWTKIFDGRSTEGFDVEGEAKVVDGALVLGSERTETKLTWKKRPTNFDLRFEFANEQGTVGQFEIETRDGAEKSSSGMLAVAGAADLPKWNLLVASVDCDPREEGSGSSTQLSASGAEKAFGSTFASLVRAEYEMGTPGELTVRWTVPAKYRLTLRNVYVRERPAL